MALTTEQQKNAAIIVSVVKRRNLPPKAAVIAVATAMQESSLRNIDYGDRDSVGLFQQRPSMGWGTVSQILDPYYSTNKFLDELVTVSNWQNMAVTVAAQKVQRSAFPLAYAKHETMAQEFVSSQWGAAIGTSEGAAPAAAIGGTSTWQRVAKTLIGIALIAIALIRLTGMN